MPIEIHPALFGCQIQRLSGSRSVEAPHSDRNATAGGTRIAPPAGPSVAIAAIALMTSVTVANTSGSVGAARYTTGQDPDDRPPRDRSDRFGGRVRVRAEVDT